ncbi:MAG TPA: RsmE family RNA methyltransferase [Pirellulales bacterium]|nr:RsmE family RNA methyltransferase [Pirellulales bacterium]
MSERFFVEQPIATDEVELAGPEAHHLLHVMRAKAGDTVRLFDNSGCEFQARIERLGKQAVRLAIVAREAIERELAHPIVLGAALPKGERQKWLIEKLTELGVTRLIPLETRRGVAQPSENAVARLRRGVIEASKQCGRTRLLEIGEPASLAAFAAAAPADALRWIAQPQGEPARPLAGRTAPLFAAVGPEGGFTDDEVAATIAAGWSAVTLGPRILRVETAAILLAAWAQ